MRVETETEILRTPDVVFSWIAEPEKAMKWQKNVKRGDIVDSKRGVVGTTFTELIEENGESIEMHGTITKFVENENIGFHIRSKIHEFDIDYSLKLTDKSTRISIKAIIEWKFPMNVISLLLGKRMKKKITKELESELNELKRLCEA